MGETFKLIIEEEIAHCSDQPAKRRRINHFELSPSHSPNSVESANTAANELQKLTGDIHEEVESHNRLLDRMGNSMDVSRGILSGTMDRFKMDSQILHAELNQNHTSFLSQIFDQAKNVVQMYLSQTAEHLKIRSESDHQQEHLSFLYRVLCLKGLLSRWS
ncbi:hypothetical protein C1H46_013278 [Malus baccata]|uniref:t-SNARE coiled-coil homology domain-containing protein n=1 Tax=Malus baccata TaxID=106549 RepID=A0A540MQR6_MALBA|nr:hypothetical protein C1H46_013278 [Malus baccata]